MSLTRPIPRAAMPVVRVLRKDVPRPEMLPKLSESALPIVGLRWRSNSKLPGDRCAMGLHPKSTSYTPSCSEDFADGICSQRAVTAMWHWHDEQTDPVALRDAIWPEEKQ